MSDTVNYDMDLAGVKITVTGSGQKSTSSLPYSLLRLP